MTIKSIIYETLEKENKQFVPQNHNPSSASFKTSTGKIVGKDMLSMYYKWKGVAPSNPSPASSILKMRLGDGVHTVVAGILAKAGIKALAEVGGKFHVATLKRPISYRVDGLHELNGELEVLEVKSVDEDQIIGRGWGIREKGPKADHLLQCICYFNVVPGVRRIRLLYIARDSGEMEEFILEKVSADSYAVLQGSKILDCPFSFRGITERWGELERALETNIIPPIEFRVWLNEEREFMKVKQIKGEKFKSQWEALYSPYADMIYKDPKNYQAATFNALLDKGDLDAIRRLA